MQGLKIIGAEIRQGFEAFLVVNQDFKIDCKGEAVNKQSLIE